MSRIFRNISGKTLGALQASAPFFSPSLGFGAGGRQKGQGGWMRGGLKWQGGRKMKSKIYRKEEIDNYISSRRKRKSPS